MTTTKRLTPRQRGLLTLLANGQSVVDADYLSHVTPGMPSPVEIVLCRLSDRGLIDWPGGVSDVTITDAGRAALVKGPKPKAIDQCRARGCGGLLGGVEREIFDGASACCGKCGREHLFHVAHDGAPVRVEIERKPRVSA